MKKIFSTLLFVLICASVIGVAFADVGELREMADKGDLQAMTDLGIAYLQGEGIAKNVKIGIKYIKQAAEKNHPAAQYTLGTLYNDGIHIKKDYKEAAKWYKKAAETGYAAAESSLGVLYYEGKGVKKDSRQAEKWFNNAAKHGDPAAQYNIAVLCEDRGDIKNAIKWYGKAAAQGDKDALQKLEIYGKKGSVSAQYELAIAYYNDRVYNTARTWFEKASENNSAEAQYMLGMMYYQGLGGNQDFLQAERWLTRAANNGNAKAMEQLVTVSKQANNQRNIEAQKAEVARQQAEAKKKEQAATLMNNAKNKYWHSDYPASVGYRSVGQQLEKAFVNPSWSLEKDEGGSTYPVFTGIARYQGRRAIYKVVFSANIEAMGITEIYVNDRMIYNIVSAALAPMLGFGTTSDVLNDFLDAIYSGE